MTKDVPSGTANEVQRMQEGGTGWAAAEIQVSLEQQGAGIRAIIEQNARQSTDIRLVREDQRSGAE